MGPLIALALGAGVMWVLTRKALDGFMLGLVHVGMLLAIVIVIAHFW